MKRLSSRRTILKGLGVSIALPFFESLNSSIAYAAAVPKFVVIYKPNGEVKDAWLTSGGTLPEVLQPFAPVQSQISIISGLSHTSASRLRLGDHGTRVGAFLTGALGFPATVAELPTVISASRSIDFRIADYWKTKPLVIGAVDHRVEANRPNPAYYQDISWEGPRPAPRHRKPTEVFEAIYSGTAAPSTVDERQKQQAVIHNSILDYAKDSITSINAKLSTKDKAKMDEYLTSIREQEIVIGATQTQVNTCKADNAYNTNSPLFHKNNELFMTLIAQAFACGKTNVATLVLDAESSGVIDDHHSWSHDVSPAGIVKYTALNKAYNAQVAKFITQLKNTAGSSGTLLDDTIVLYGSGIGESHNHEYTKLPLLVAGGTALGLKPGRVVSTSGPLNNLLLTIARKMGLNLASFADSTGTVAL